MKEYYVTNEIEVDADRAKTIADNGELGDKNCTLWSAPSTQHPGQIVYIETNGDPVYVGSYDDGYMVDITTDMDVIEMIDMDFDMTIDDLTAKMRRF